MLIYILKFSACLFIFMAFYKLFLERENMHQLKRFYLLLALVLSITFPLITFTQFVEPITITQNFSNAQQITIEHEAIEQTSLWDYLPQLLWTIYGIGVLIFGLKFVLNLNVIFKKIHRNPKLKAHRYINVLLSDEVTPHTFFNYIFLNKYKYESQQIPQEVFIHEQTHAEQKHSLDILFIELLQILFWFNPLLYFIKRDIKLNHEFLADKAVLLNGIQPSQYQQLLLAFSSNAAEPQLANAINYSSIKKRFTLMKTRTSKRAVWIKSLLILPLLSVLIYGFSTKEVLKKEVHSELVQQKATKAEIEEYNKLAKKYNAVDIEERIIKKKDLERLETIYRKMTLVQRAKAQPFPECNQTQNYSREEDNKKFSEANYYYKGERITFEKANELLDKNN
ncbi:MAG: M56 family metallopeptidase, partial [Gelidibacter sp.]|nr:M56 family metallopeptidase [Gelidibacter sp.]